MYSRDDQRHQADVQLSRWFQKWVLHFIWDAEYDLTIRKIYEQMMEDVRIDISPTELTGHQAGRPSILAAQRPS
ncbi:uncharacterized protein DS421_1g10360 [Arachis hypogaea]|nr:uncharacterized protein DS421_1g10360 [Arachis hypogaea]